MKHSNMVKDALLGLAVGDALGVPVEFIDRAVLDLNPVTGMREFGSHNQPMGTWSDDSSLTLCLAEMLCGKFDLQDLARRFVDWRDCSYWTAHGQVFDVGIATSAAIHRLYQGVTPTLAGGDKENSNGNGSLMRILPLAFYLRDKTIAQRFDIVRDVSSLTHRHIRSVIACFIYIEYALQIIAGLDKLTAYKQMQQLVNNFLHTEPICSERELSVFHRILENPIGDYEIVALADLGVDEIYSSGYVVNTLEASLWCINQTDNYRDAVLKAVNLGSDTDTTGAVTGGLAGLLYGTASIPEEWLRVLARRKDIEDLCNRLATKLEL